MSYNGQDITYDGIGNPISYYNGFTFSWQGRRLVGATRGTDTLSFTYNDDGIRTSKTVNGVKTTYYLSGSQILAEVTPSYEIMYIYDASGSPIGMQYRSFTYDNGVYDVYLFEKSLQGDILAVYGADGTKYIEYTYNAWGNFTTTYHNDGENTSAVNNRFTYRGYYYDSDLGMYYLNARYYDQNIRRFINADEYVTTGQGFVGFNMFAYCLNNPVMFSDFSGDYAIYWLVIVINVSRAAKKIMASHNYKHNDKLDQGDNSTYNEMIKNQNSDIIAEYTYGVLSARINSCEAIAVHNTKVLLGLESTLSETIRDMQTCNGMWLFGLFGSKPSKIGKLLSFYGIEYEKVSIDQVDSPGIYIISYLRSNGMIHTVAVTYDGVGYYAYNKESNTDHPSKYSSLYFEIYYIRRE